MCTHLCLEPLVDLVLVLEGLRVLGLPVVPQRRLPVAHVLTQLARELHLGEVFVF